MQKFLIPLDGSKTGETALKWGKFLAQKGKKLELLRCYHPLASLYSFPDFATPPPVSYDLSGFARFARQYLEEVAKENELEATLTVKEGDPAETIVIYDETSDSDAILMATHGQGGLGKWLLGSTATKVVRASKKPVLLIRPDESDAEPKLEKILVCLDGSELAERGLARAADLAREFGASLKLYRAVDETPYPMSDIQTVLLRAEESARDYLAEKATELEGLEVETTAQLAPVVDGVLAQAKDCDLVVMTSHGYSGFRRWILGSIAEAVMQRCDKPLLIVHER